MSKRDLFDNKNKVLSDKTQTEIGNLAESSGNVQQRLIEKGRFIPVVNFEYPQNFARYGKAEKYYTDSFSRIYNDYPYDGSLKEKNDFRNKSSYIDLYILDNKYPRSTGHSIFSPNGWGTVTNTFGIPTGGSPLIVAEPSIIEYVQVVGGPNEAPSEYISDSLQKQFQYANVYDPSKNRESNLKCNFDEGVTIEFWMLKPSGSLVTGSSDIEVPAMLSNGVTGSVTIMLYTSGAADPASPRIIFAANDDTNLVSYGGGGGFIPLSSDQMFDGRWHHYAFSVQNSGSSVEQKVYFDGNIIGENVTPGVTLTEVTGALKLNVGASREGSINASIRFPSDGYGKLSGSIDEFRYWKTARTADQIGKYWFTQFGGGTNIDDANVDLGVYLKFNEGITGVTATDSIVLDYSGRISNGTWVGYTPQGRSTGSAIDSYLGEESEFKDPIIYSFNPRVVAALEPLQDSGSNYDLTNNSSIYNSIPSWITEEDEIGSGDLLNLTQIMASYLDTLHLQIEAIPRLKDKIYNDPSIIKPKPFSSRLLESQGFVAPEIFANADVLSQILNRDTTQKFELDLTDIKNTIYQNIYNNLVHIYKLKGTNSAFRNLVRCFGVDERIIRTNIYGNNVEYELKDNYENTVFKKRYADFNDPDRFYATVYQQTQSGNPNSVSYISGSGISDFGKEGYTSFTLESEVIFPKKRDRDDLNYFTTPFVTSSLFGFHSATSSVTDFTWPALDWNMQVYAYREESESNNVRFALSSSTSVGNAVPFELISDLYYDVYDNQKWNFAVRIKPTREFAGTVSGTLEFDSNYTIEFYGVSADAGVITNEFLLATSSVPRSNAGYLSAPKRIYAGAYRTNFTGSIIERSDVKISSVRYWASYLNDDVIKIHARDPSNYGSSAPYKSTYPWVTDLGQAVPQVATLAMNWNFANVTASDGGISGTPTISDAGYTVADFSSGSTETTSRYGYFGDIVNLQHTGRGDFYLPNDTKVVDVKYIYSGKQVAPEVIQASDAINSLGESDIYFTRDSRPVTFTYMVEKSMYQTISDEMLNIFSTIVDFNNLIGEPVNRYRQKYKNMEKLRQLFFEKVENTPDLDRYVDFYKWIDSSLSTMLEQLVPMSADISDDVRTMVESHILERNKYQSKFPTLEFEAADPETGIRGINESLYNWKYGHAPVGATPQNQNCFWWKERAERYTPLLSSSVVGVNSDKTQILSASTQVLNRSYSTPYRLSVDKSPAIHGGVNYNQNKKIDFAKSTLKFGSSTNLSFEDIETPKDCTDVYDPFAKTKLAFKTTTNDTSYYSGNGDIFAPFSLYSSSIYNDLGRNNTRITNFHSDTYGNDKDVPLQSPFTEFAVGGLQYRHVAPLSTTERPEGWNLVAAFTNTKAVSFEGADRDFLAIASPSWNSGQPDGTDKYSIGFWLYLTNSGVSQTIFDAGLLNTANGVVIKTSAADKFFIQEPWSGGIAVYLTTYVIPTNQWIHVVWARDGSVADGLGDYNLYVDGVAVSFDSVTLRTGNYNQPTAVAARIADGLTGYLDEVTWWKKELTQDNVTEIYSGGKVIDLRDTTPSPSLVSWYRMGDFPGDELRPLSAAGIKDVFNTNNTIANSVFGDGPEFVSNVPPGTSNFTLNFPEATSPRATYYRDPMAKRPVNIKNIKINSLGNYSKDYEIVQTSGRFVNNLAFVQSGGFDIGPIGNPILNNAVKSQFALSMSGPPETEKLTFPDPTWNSGGADQLGGADDPDGGWSFSGWIEPVSSVTSIGRAVLGLDWPGAGNKHGVRIELGGEGSSLEGNIQIREAWTDAPLSDSVIFTSSVGLISFNEWNHVVFSHKTSNTSSTAQDPFLLINGVEHSLGTSPTLGPPLGIFKPPRSGEPSLFGAVNDFTFGLTGSMDEFALWNRALSREEAQYIYGEGRFAQDLFQRGIDNKLIGWWRMGDTEGDTDGPSGIILDVLGKNNATASSTATGPTFVTSPLLGGRYKSNASKISRGSHPSIFVNRFAAPGGPETDGDSNGGPGLDRYSGEYSVYNSMNWRNPLTRKALRPLLSSPANQFGYFSSGGFSPGTILSRDYLAVYPGPYAAGFYDAFPVDSQIVSSSVNSLDYSGTPNFHKVHRNVRRRMESGSIFTGSRFDNAWVTHPIPQSDLQYAWINSSYTSIDPSGLGYWYADQFEFTTREAVVFQEPFTSSLDAANWTSQKVTMRQSDDSDNWVARMGTLLGTNKTDPRLLTTANDYNLPFRVDFSYARGAFQSPASRLYLEFDGNSVLSSSNGAATSVSSSDGGYAWSLWLKIPDLDVGPSLPAILWIHDSDSNNPAFSFGYAQVTRTFSVTRNWDGPVIDKTALWVATTGSNDKWIHFCIVDNDNVPGAGVDSLKLYVNGEFVDGGFSNPAGNPRPMTGSFFFGARDDALLGGNFAFSGSMDSISWWNRELTESEVQELYNNGTPGNVQNVSFWPTEITASNQVHYWQLGDANPDEINLGTPPAKESVFDWAQIPGSFDEDLFAYGTGDLQFLEYPGYNMAPPQPNENDETMSFEISTDSGVTWITASVFKDDGTFTGDKVGFIERSYTFRGSTAGETGRIRFRQDNFANPKRDNWAINDVTISEISYVDPVKFSPYGDFWSRISGTTDTKFGNSIAEIEADPRLTASLPTVYNGLNYNIYEPIDADNEFLGYSINASYTFGGETGNVIQYLNTTTSPDGFASGSLLPSSTELSKSVASLTNAILLKRNGPYGYPIWKQTRTAEHALARYYRNNNIITVTQEPGKTVLIDGTQYIPPFGNTRQYQEPAINSQYQDLEYKLGMRVTTYPKNKPPHYVIRPVTMKLSYGNNLNYFNSPQLNRRAKYDKIDPSDENQTYDVIKDLYLEGELNSLESPVYSFISLKYREWVYPKGENTYIGENRTRTDYTETFWRDSRKDRDILGTTKKFGGFNSQGVAVISQSAWALDGRNDFDDPGVESLSYPTNSAGELQNDYTLAWNNSIFKFPSSVPAKFTCTSINPAPLYNRKCDPFSLYGVAASNGNEFINANITSSDFIGQSEFSGTNRGYQLEVGNINGRRGDAIWQAGELAGRVENNVFISASSSPFYDNYDLWREELRLKNKEYSIVPEFRISEHMEFYVNQEGATVNEESLRDSFLSENENFLSIFGTTISSSVDDFFETYSYGDFMKYFEIIDADHKEMSGLEKTLKLKCKALKKFIAYDGFYPSERCLQIAQEFSRSYGPYVTSSGDYDWSVTDEKMRPLLEPFLAPGILFNTIKAGMACDYPIHTSSFDHVRYYVSGGAALGIDEGIFPTKYYAIGTSSANGTNGWDYRVPFEAILAPETINGIPLPDMEVNPQYKFTGSLSGTGSVSLTASLAAPSSDNLYKFGISNFLAESVEFFLKGGKMTRFVSDTSDSGYTFDSGSYGMRLRLRRSMNRDRVKPDGFDFIPANDDYQQTDLYETMTMYSRPSAFGPPVAATNVIFPTGSDPSVATSLQGSDGDWTQRQQNADSLFGRNPSFTPPYYDGECWFDIVYTAPAEGITLTLDELFQSASVVQTRIEQDRKVWNSIDPLDPSTGLLDSDLTGSYPMFNDNVNKFSMKLGDCVNVFNKRFVQSTEDPTKFSPQWVIELKMETPMLNFGDKTIRPLYWKSGSNGGNVQINDTNLFGSTATPIGMWHQFGTIPREDEGIFLSIEPIDQDYLSSRQTGSTIYPGAATGDFKSMVDIVGFTPNDSRKLGTLRSAKTLYEAVVAVPYIIQDGERKFIRINKSLINRALKEIEEPGSTKTPPGDSIIDMVSKMKKYILPPRMDFIINPDFVDPYAMYIFEFSHTFDQNDLSYMWQNTAPQLGTSFEEATAELSHKLINREILKNYKNKLRWMVFKVKQRGNNNYYSKVTGQFQSPDKLDKLQKPYSYNWPYDYCSIVEFVRMQSEIKYSSDVAVDVTDSFADVNEELKTGIRATVGLPPTPNDIVAGMMPDMGDPFETATEMKVKSMVVENLNTDIEEEE